MNMMKISKNEFEKEVLQSDVPVLIDFYADWCGPCKMLSPIVEEISKEHPEIKVVKVNVDEQGELAGQFGVMSIPTLVVMKNGEVTNSSVGYRPKTDILKMI